MRNELDYRREMLHWPWRIVRVPILLFLVILEPIVAFGCGALALLGVLTTLLFALIGAPHFPVWTMLTISISFGLVLVLYEGLIRVISD